LVCIVSKIPIGQLNPAAYNPRKDLQPGGGPGFFMGHSGYLRSVIWQGWGLRAFCEVRKSGEEQMAAS
jgi:hypothetical protein